MSKIVLVVSLAFALAGCAQLTNAYNVLTGTSVSPTAVYVAANAFDAVEATATNYLRLRRCSASSGPVCRDPKVSSQLIPAVRAGRIARNNLEAFMKAHPGQLGPTGLYDALTGATATIRSIETTYHIGS